MIILGIDPGTATTGFGLISISNEKANVLKFGLIETNKEEVHARRLLSIFNQTWDVIKQYNPDVLAIERLYFASNARTAMRVGQAQGVIIYAAAKSRIKIVEYAPQMIKKIISGNGRADKKDIQRHLRKIFGPRIRSRKKKRTHFDNEADALAVALCHAIKEDLIVKGGD